MEFIKNASERGIPLKNFMTREMKTVKISRKLSNGKK